MQRLTAILAVAMLTLYPFGARAAASKPIIWLFAGGGPVAAIARDAKASHLLDAGKPFILGSSKGIPSSWDAVHVAEFRAFADIQAALEKGLAPDIKGVMYDYESWPFTPKAEQKNPLTKQAADLVHAQGLMFFTAPAVDLVTIMAPGDKSAQGDIYIRLGLASNAARYADVFDIQAQRFLNDTALYARFVKNATWQARKANPNVIVLAGLSTQPHGMVVTADQILAAIAATRGIVDGYWFNIPGPGPACPTCKKSRPDIALDVLHRLPQ